MDMMEGEKEEIWGWTGENCGWGKRSKRESSYKNAAGRPFIGAGVTTDYLH
jgi:hypothetical protein